MAKFLLRLVSVVLCIFHYGSSQKGLGTEAELRDLPIGVEYRSYFVDLPAEDVPPLNPDDDAESPRGARTIPPLPFIDPGLFYSPFEAFTPVQAVLFDAVVDRIRTDMDIVKQRQKVMLKYVECSSPKASECKPVSARVEVAEDDSQRGYWEWLQSVNAEAPGTVTCPPCPTQSDEEQAPKGYWEWLASVHPTPPGSVPCSCPPPKGDKSPGPNTKTTLRHRVPSSYWDWLLNRPAADVVRADKFYAVMVAFKKSIERLTVRQNMLYEYVNCSCRSTTECGTALKPVLDLMFVNNQNVTGEMVKHLVAGRRSSIIDNLFGWLPNFNGWISFNPFAVLGDLLKPIYYGAASYSSGPGHGATYTVSSSGKPSDDQYIVHLPGGGTSHVSTSTNGGATSVSGVTTDLQKETDEKPVDHADSKDTTHEVKKESADSRAEEKKEPHETYFKDTEPGAATNYGPQEQSSSNVPKVIQSSLENAKIADGVQLSQASSEAVKSPEVHTARQLLFGGGPGMVYPAFANRVPAYYTGVQPGIAAAGVGVNQGLAAAQYTTG